MENFRNLIVPGHKAKGYQILLVALSSGPIPTVPKLKRMVIIFTWAYIEKIVALRPRVT